MSVDRDSDKRRAAVVCRPPRLEDGGPIRRLIDEIGTLEANTSYAYLLMATHFAPTCTVAELDGELIGFVWGYRPPSDPSTWFVWQVGVSPAARGLGVARTLLTAALRQPGNAGVRWLEATVEPDNQASRALFTSMARRMGASLEVRPHFEPEHFAAPGHAPEHLFRIGPLDPDPEVQP